MVVEPASSPGATSPPSRKPLPARRLHEPFVSPEFGANRISPRLEDAMGGNDPEQPTGTGPGTVRDAGDVHRVAAPLYTVNAARADNHSVLSVPPPVLSDSLLLRKRLDVADAGRLSVVGLASGNPLIPASLKSMGFQPKFSNVPPPSAPSNLTDSTSVVESPRDMSPLITEALCSWGQAVGPIVGQAVFESFKAERRDGVHPSPRGPSLTTTGLFPQMMTLRFSGSVRVASVHLRASSVLRLVVQPGEASVVDGRMNGKTVTLPADGRPGEWTGEQDINVDVRDVKSFESTRSLTVVIAASSEAFCSIHGIYALGTRV